MMDRTPVASNSCDAFGEESCLADHFAPAAMLNVDKKSPAAISRALVFSGSEMGIPILTPGL